MASLIYNKAIQALVNGDIDFGADTFKCMLVTASYTPNKDTHDFRDDVTDEVTGTGYTSGGVTVTCTPALDTDNDRVTLTFSNPSWSDATITARAAVIYKSRGGASSADEIIAYVDFGGNVSSTAGTFAVTFSNPLIFQV